MAGVTQRATGAALSRRTHDAARGTFDLSSWQGLTAVLQTARQSNLPDAEYSRLRDRVLAYAQSGGDQSLKTEILKILNGIGGTTQSESTETVTSDVVQEIKERSVSVTDRSIQKPPSPRSRPQPRFVIPRSRVTSTPATDTPALETEAPQIPDPAPVVTISEEVPVFVAENKIPPPPAPVSTPEEKKATPPPEAAFKTLEEHKRRIAEIKHEVNVRVGNPMLLVGGKNPAGRAYMAALLAALKAAGGGGNINVAMDALEEAYQQVIATHEDQKTQEEEVAITEPIPPMQAEDVHEVDEVQIDTVAVQESPKISDVVTSPSISEIDSTSEIPKLEEVHVADVEEEVSVPDNAPLSHAMASTALTQSTPIQSEVVDRDPGEEIVSEVSEPVLGPQEEKEDGLNIALGVEEKEEYAPPAKLSTDATQPQSDEKPKDLDSENELSAAAPKQVELDSLRARLAALESVPQAQPVVEEDEVVVSPILDRVVEKPLVSDQQEERITAELESLKERLSLLQQSKKVSPVVPKPTTPVARPISAAEEKRDFQQNRKTSPSMGTTHRSPAESAELNARANAATQEQTLLDTPQVTEALQELLAEWSLFSKSGLLGMGPGGMEHPLYEQLSQLPMSSVVSGRFENATPDTLQSIKDYVVAWQHEQGISYLQSETFEHYLRRVVLRILKRQNQYA